MFTVDLSKQNDLVVTNMQSINLTLKELKRVRLTKNVWHQRTIKLMKGKALRKHSLHKKTAASVLLKPFISSNE